MAESKKLVIKINYDKNASDLPINPPNLITVWHKQRIATALAIMLVLLFAGLFWFNSLRETRRNSSEPSAAMHLPSGDPDNASASTFGGEEINLAKTTHLAESAVKGVHDKTQSVSSETKREFLIIFDKVVIRASLNSALKANEPYSMVTSPIRLRENQTIELYYFNELRGIKHKIFYHIWSKDGKQVYKKQLLVQKKNLKVNSLQILSNNDKGNWQIQLVDTQGKVFSEVNFIVSE